MGDTGDAGGAGNVGNVGDTGDTGDEGDSPSTKVPAIDALLTEPSLVPSTTETEWLLIVKGSAAGGAEEERHKQNAILYSNWAQPMSTEYILKL